MTELAFLAVDGTDIDDAAKVGGDHVFNHLLGHVEHAVEVGGNNGVPVGLAHFSELAVAGDACVVNQHADRTVLGLYFGEGFNRRVPVTDIAD